MSAFESLTLLSTPNTGAVRASARAGVVMSGAALIIQDCDTFISDANRVAWLSLTSQCNAVAGLMQTLMGLVAEWSGTTRGNLREELITATYILDAAVIGIIEKLYQASEGTTLRDRVALMDAFHEELLSGLPGTCRPHSTRAVD